MREVAVIGVGMTRFAKMPEADVIDLGIQACLDAIKDAGIDPRAIQTAYCGHARTGQLLGREGGVGQTILYQIGVSGIPMVDVSNFCASGSTAFREAWLAVASGLYDIAIAIGVEQLTARSGKGQPLTSDNVKYLTAMGFSPPTFFAQIARRHMYEYGTTPEQLAMVAAKNRGNACFNPRAQYQEAVTVEQVLASKVIADPLHLLDCCPTTDGGAAAILCSKEVAARYTNRPVFVAGSGLRSGAYRQMRDITLFPSDAQSAKDAYEMAGIGPGDVDVAEVHDCFSIAELIHYEDLGFCAKGEGGRMIQEGRTAIGGDVAVNPSGGLLSKGHPLGATGVGQIAEIVWQLRSEATGRQVEGAKVGLTHCAGGFQDTLEMGEVCASTVHLFKR